MSWLNSPGTSPETLVVVVCLPDLVVVVDLELTCVELESKSEEVVLAGLESELASEEDIPVSEYFEVVLLCR